MSTFWWRKLQLTLVAGRSWWSWGRRTFLSLYTLGAARAGRAYFTWLIVCTCRVSRPCDAVPWVRNHCGWNCVSFALLFYLIIFIVILKWIGWQGGCARSGTLPFERRQKACIGRGCQSRRGSGRGRSFLLLGFWLNQGEPRWVFEFMGASGQAGQWDTHIGMTGSQGGRQNKIQPTGGMEATTTTVQVDEGSRWNERTEQQKRI